ncbi:MAG: response regulator transcription factor [Deinococcales bacterium]|jgi:DNA-binding response OmpR family regulator|nr:response regulator transcription factor [Truepera sp.]NLG09277.1 response regulator transcription factor [Deinococcales bacterium]HET9026477.1 response regulator transcription factor [Trueperaceae bacterium]
MSRILVVEDDADAAQVVSAYLTREGYAVEVAHDGAAGLQAALTAPPALVVLDWMLPGVAGPEFLTALRRAQRTPVIMLTARSEESDRIVGLELGADDYVVKPFSPRELVARVRAVLRRSQAREVAEADEAVEHRGLRVDPLQRQASFAGREVELTTLEFDLLFALARAPGRVFSRNDLIERVWGPDFTGVDRVVDVHVSNLRQKLASVGADALLVTVRGVGYKVA